MSEFHPVVDKIARHFGLGRYGELLAQEYVESYLDYYLSTHEATTTVGQIREVRAIVPRKNRLQPDELDS